LHKEEQKEKLLNKRKRENKGKRPEKKEKVIDVDMVEKIRKHVSENKFDMKSTIESKFNLTQRELNDIIIFGGLKQVKIGRRREWEVSTEYGSPKN
jgi:hypothetical protein